MVIATISLSNRISSSTWKNNHRFRSSHRGCSVKKDVHKNFTKFTGKHLCQSLFFNKVAGLGPATLLKKRDSGTRPATLLKKRLCLTQVFSCEFLLNF